MISPELSTFPRVDTTGVAKYALAVPERFLGAERARTVDGIGDPWGGIHVEWDFPEVKYAIEGYSVHVGLTPQFQNKINPAGSFGPGNDLYWGHLDGGTAAGVLEATVVEIVDFGAPGGLHIIRPNTQYFVLVMAAHSGGANSARAEMMGVYTAPLPTEGEYPYIDPPPIYPWDRPLT